MARGGYIHILNKNVFYFIFFQNNIVSVYVVSSIYPQKEVCVSTTQLDPLKSLSFFCWVRVFDVLKSTNEIGLCEMLIYFIPRRNCESRTEGGLSFLTNERTVNAESKVEPLILLMLCCVLKWVLTISKFKPKISNFEVPECFIPRTDFAKAEPNGVHLTIFPFYSV